MADHEQGAGEAARRQADAARRGQTRTRETMEETERTVEQLFSVGTDTLAVWGDVQQRVLRDAAQLTSTALQESARTVSRLQQTAMDNVQEMQAMAWRWFSMWPDAMRDPVRWYERAVGEMIENGRRNFHANRTGLETMAQSMERMQETAGHAAQAMQETFRDAAGRMQEVSRRAERLRAA